MMNVNDAGSDEGAAFSFLHPATATVKISPTASARANFDIQRAP
jgi:hypothetical protein